MPEFYCRTEELDKLNERYDNGGFECIIMYGRRRVGKTALISTFCKDKPVIFFSAVNTTAAENLKALSAAIMDYERPGEESLFELQSYDAALKEITRFAADKRLIFVIDEYPYLAKAYPAISAMLQHIIDHNWSNTKLFVILCGSSMSFMEHQVLGFESPLYGRRTGQFKLEPFNYKETAVFHPDLTNEENALIYGITGGVPHYINMLGVKDDIDKALLKNIFDRSGYLYEEPSNLLKQELREPAIYNAIITAVANGASRLNEICTKIGESNTTVTKYVKTLMELGILKRETPAAEKTGKKTVYQLSDFFFRFWYRFVPKNTGAIESGRIKEIYQSAVKQHLSDYMGLVFEKMCRDYLIYYAQNLPIPLSRAGQWWGTDPKEKKELQINIVGVPAEGTEYIIGSCKYRNEKTGTDELLRLKKYAAVFGKGSRYYFYIFSKSGFTEGLLEAAAHEDVMLLTLDDIYD